MSRLPRLEAFIAGPDGAPWVTFVPGIGNDASFWRAQADALASDHRTLRFEPWGCGASEAPPEDCTIDDVADGVVALWDCVGIAQSSVVGLGFGGSVTLDLAARHPSRIDRVVACCCRPRQPDDRRQFWRDRQELARTRGMDALAEMTVERWLRAELRAARPDLAGELHAAFLRNPVEGYVAYVGAFASMDIERLVRDVKAPTLLIAGEHDHGGGPVEAMRALCELLPDASLHVVAGVGHLCNHEAPDEVTRLARAHLTR